MLIPKKVRIAARVMDCGAIGLPYGLAVIGGGIFVLIVGALNALLEKVGPAPETPLAKLSGVAVILVAIAFLIGCLLLLERLGLFGLRARIKEWVDSHRPRLVKWHNNGITGLVRACDYQEVRRGFENATTVLWAVRNTMTFSDHPALQGKVTGTMADLAELEEGCIVVMAPIFIPRTSGLLDRKKEEEFFPLITMAQARELLRA